MMTEPKCGYYTVLTLVLPHWSMEPGSTFNSQQGPRNAKTRTSPNECHEGVAFGLLRAARECHRVESGEVLELLKGQAVEVMPKNEWTGQDGSHSLRFKVICELTGHRDW